MKFLDNELNPKKQKSKKHRNPRSSTAHIDWESVAEYSDNMTRKELAQHLGVTVASVQGQINAGVINCAYGRWGVTAKKVRTLFDSGHTINEIADKLKLHQSTIREHLKKMRDSGRYD